ncbi:Lrp/AsnC family transcriptional regulator [Pontibacterium sp.]|uniref:Lrp/AsnC family transcriptional regulator n=1 Tax=Pontibacterium sp. TaxID=2036026 RepID=UPI003519940B
MDKTDRKILDLLQSDCTLSVSEIAEQVNLSTTPCWKRIKRLEDEGIIKARVALLDGAKIQLGISVFVHIKTQHHDSAWLEKFAERVMYFDEVVECYRMSGEWDYLLRVVVKDIETFDVFYKKLINDIDGLSNVTSSFSMEEIKYTTKLPIK